VKDRACAEVQVFGDLDDHTEEHPADTGARIPRISAAKTITEVAKLSEWEGF
jgi:hypothetical protein